MREKLLLSSRSIYLLQDDCSVLPAESFGVPSASVGVAPEFLGGYSRSNAEELEGCYICFRPGFSAPNLITAYVVVIRWDEASLA